MYEKTRRDASATRFNDTEMAEGDMREIRGEGTSGRELKT